MNVLYHLSHCSSTKPDGWSGAPGEAQWVRALVAAVAAKASVYGITVHTVDGDLLDHPAFHADYDAFVAPHYEADVHNTDGAFWGRAAASVTGSSDDNLGLLMWNTLRSLGGYKPPEHFDWNNVNVTDYYGFRLTSANTPGVLIEHAVGNRHPQGYDYVHNEVDAIAAMHVNALAFFGGITMPVSPFNPEQEAYLKNLIRDVVMGENIAAEEMYRFIARGLGHNFGLHAPDTAVKMRELTPAEKRHDGHGRPARKKA